MHVAMQLKVPIDNASKLRDRLNVLRTMHEKDVAQFQRKIKTTPHSDKLFKENASLIERGKRLTPNNMMRLVITLGIEALDAEKDESILAKLAQDAVVRGRPRER